FVGEMNLVTPTEKPFNYSQSDSLKTPWELLIGIRGKVKKKWGVEGDLGKGLGIQSGYGRELFRVMLAVRYDNEVRDSDGDGIPDNVDKCPDEPGPPETEGCPLEDQPQVVLETDRIRLRGNILFETAEATIQRQSYKILDEVYQVLSEHPEISPVLIE